MLHLSFLNTGLLSFLFNVDFFSILASQHHQSGGQPGHHLDVDLVHLLHQLVGLGKDAVPDLMAGDHIHQNVETVADNVDELVELRSLDHFCFELQVDLGFASSWEHEEVVEREGSGLDEVAMELKH